MSVAGERNIEIIRRHEHGDLLRDIAADYGITWQRVQQIASSVGLSRRAARNHDPAVRAAALEAYGKETALVVGRRVGVSRNAIIGHWFRLRKAGLLPRAGA